MFNDYNDTYFGLLDNYLKCDIFQMVTRDKYGHVLKQLYYKTKYIRYYLDYYYSGPNERPAYRGQYYWFKRWRNVINNYNYTYDA